jgi:hypothetical protein
MAPTSSRLHLKRTHVAPSPDSRERLCGLKRYGGTGQADVEKLV